MPAPSRIDFEEEFEDGSGIEYSISCIQDNNTQSYIIQFSSDETVCFPMEKIDWLIDRLNYIKKEVIEEPRGEIKEPNANKGNK